MTQFSHFCNSFRAALNNAGLSFDGELLADSLVHRFKVNGDSSPNSWYVLHSDGVPNGIFGCWKRGIEGDWCSKPEQELSKEERLAYRKQIEEAKRKRDAEQAQRRAQARTKAQQILATGIPATSDHPYLTAKNVAASPGMMIGDWLQRNTKDCLLIPFGVDGQVTTLQAISATGKLIGDSNKDWLIGGQKSGSYFTIGDLQSANTIIISEGYATAATIHEATGHAVIMAGDANNLLPVAKKIRSIYPQKPLVIASDNDIDTEGNPGLKAAQIAAQAVSAALVVPDFTPMEISQWRLSYHGKAPTDFNDIQMIRGLQTVQSIFTPSKDKAADTVSQKKTDRLLIKVDDRGNESLINHNKAAEILYRKEFKSLLYYDPVVCGWYQYQPTGVFNARPDLTIQQAVYRAINRNCGDLGFSASYVSGVAKCLLFESVTQPITPKGMICFSNGVLDIKSRQLLTHSPKYFFTSQLPFEWQPNADDPHLVIDWLKEATGNNEDQIQLIRAFFNAVIVGRPDLQRFLEIIGFGGSGKGTLLRLLCALIGNEAICSTQLKHLEENRFETAKIFGKKLVVVTDAEKWHGDVSVLKSITGQDPIRFEEKNKQAGESFTYGGMVLILANQHTTSTDYSSGIQRRRITLMFDHVVSDEKKRDLDSEFASLLPAVAKWALDMPEHEVTAYLRNTNTRVKSLQTVRMETLAATNPVAGWLMDNVTFDSNVVTQVGSKEKVSKTTGGRDEGKETRQEFDHWETRLYPNYATWCEQSGKQPISLQGFTRTVIDVSNNMLNYSFVKKGRQGGTGKTVIKGLSLCRPSEDLVKTYPIDCEECEDSEDLKKYGSNQESKTASPVEVDVNFEVCESGLHSPHILHNQCVSLHSGLHNAQNVKTCEDQEDAEYF